MKNFHKPGGAVFCALIIGVSGCRMGGGAGANFSPGPQPAPTPAIPEGGTPQLGPSAPFPEGQPGGPALEGPTIDGPQFPPSSRGFDRYRSQSPRDNWRSNYAETAPPPIVPEGPIAQQRTSGQQRQSDAEPGYVELPPAP